MKQTQKIGALLCVLFLPGVAMAAPAPKIYVIRDFIMGNALWLQEDNAKRNVDINTKILKPAKALFNPDREKEVKASKMVVVGPVNKTYAFGFYVFHQEEHSERFFPLETKSIYYLRGYDTQPKPALVHGEDIMFPGFPPVDFLNSPWIKVADTVTRTSTIVDVPLAVGMNYLTIHLDPFNKIQETKRTLNAGPEGDSPWVKLDDNNNATFAIELVLPKKPLPSKMPK